MTIEEVKAQLDSHYIRYNEVYERADGIFVIIRNGLAAPLRIALRKAGFHIVETDIRKINNQVCAWVEFQPAPEAVEMDEAAKLRQQVEELQMQIDDAMRLLAPFAKISGSTLQERVQWTLEAEREAEDRWRREVKARRELETRLKAQEPANG